MSNWKLRLDYAAIGREILKGSEAESMIRDAGSQAFSACDESKGYIMEMRNTGQRVSAVIVADEPHAYSDNLSNNTLEKAMRSIR